MLILGCFRAHIEAKEWGRHGINASNQKEKVGILKQKYFEVIIKGKSIFDARESQVASLGRPSLSLLCLGLLHRLNPFHGSSDSPSGVVIAPLSASKKWTIL